MKKLPAKPPKGLVFERQPLHAHELDVDLHRKLMQTPTFEETTREDFKRILAELKNEPGKI
ncbi:hypothetical protein [Duganella callida]|uniref:Uncharacterized protein n=1 Tax=Duganella callida TaxID=2561932 RepID=A0A4Y9SJI4_9BURK|nr:hypothetical protein [Duganella callida]TFW22566.1 hypothetical protein E4L98_11985 [Duganella callida]